MSANLKLLKKRRDKQEKLFEHYMRAVLIYSERLKVTRTRLKAYNRKIEKALEAQKHTPKDPTRIVEV